MTDAEIVALVMAFDDAYWANRDKGGEPGNMKAGIRAVVAALTEAGRLVPDGCVCIDRATYDSALTLAWNTDADVHDALLLAEGR